MSRVSSCRALTSLKFSLSSIRRYDIRETLFPKNLNLPLLSSLVLENFAFCGGGLVLENFAFCGGENGCAEPFSTFTKLNSLILRSCEVKDAQILSISSETLVKLALLDNFAKIELSVPSLCTFTFTGDLIQKICGSSLSSIKQVNIDHEISPSVNNALALLSCLQDLANVELLTVNSTTLEILSLVPDLLEVKLPSFCNLRSLEVKMIPLHHGHLFLLMKDVMLKKVAAKSSKEADKLRKAFKAGLELPAIPDGIVDFLRQNPSSAEVNITTDYPGCFNLKQVEESIKGEKIINYRSQIATPASFSVAPACADESAFAPASAVASASAAPPSLHLCRAEI
ncbi:uncharacterized protein [Medicago truncatula]|nr:uncharacterized protein LOC120580247 [Medicago truncatula]